LKAYSSLGYKHSPEAIYKIRAAASGKLISDETKAKLSKAFKGENNPFFGKVHSDALKLQLSINRKGEKNPMFNKEKSPEFIAHMYKDKSGDKNPKALPKISLF
jgi:group I intron endonuclease